MREALEQGVADAVGLDHSDGGIAMEEEEAGGAAKEVVNGLDGAGEEADGSPGVHEVELGDFEAGGGGEDALGPVEKIDVGDAGAVLAADDLGEGPGVFTDDGDAFGEPGGELDGVVGVLGDGVSADVDEDPKQEKAGEGGDGAAAEARSEEGGGKNGGPANKGDGFRGEQGLGESHGHEIAVGEERRADEAGEGEGDGDEEEGGGEDPGGAAGVPGGAEDGFPEDGRFAKAEDKSDGEEEEDESDLCAEAGVGANEAGEGGGRGPEVGLADAGGGGHGGVLRDEEQPGKGTAEVQKGAGPTA